MKNFIKYTIGLPAVIFVSIGWIFMCIMSIFIYGITNLCRFLITGDYDEDDVSSIKEHFVEAVDTWKPII